MDPGTALAVVSLALQVADGLYKCYKGWRDCDDDVKGLRKSLLWLANIFKQLEIVLRRPGLKDSLVKTIILTSKACEESVEELKDVLDSILKDGAPEGLLQKLKAKGRRACYPFRASTIARLAEIIQDLKDDLDLAIDILNLDTNAAAAEELTAVHEDVKKVSSKLSQVSQKLNAKDDEDLRQKILEWLAPPEYSSSHNQAREKCQPGTGRWLLKSSLFSEWIRGSSSKLWLHGGVGCGKTVLCSTIIEHIKGMNASDAMPSKAVDVAYFYFSFDLTPSHDSGSIAKALLAQLCSGSLVPPSLKALYEKLQPSRAPTRDLLEALVSILGSRKAAESKSPPRDVFLILDGLDEVPYGSSRDTVLELVKELEKSGPHVHILVSSREEQDIGSALSQSRDWKRFPIGMNLVEDDIALFIACQIEDHSKLKSLPSEVKRDIEENLVFGANGMQVLPTTDIYLNQLKCLGFAGLHYS
jgi:ankyrin repeat domain-containing protein 50